MTRKSKTFGSSIPSQGIPSMDLNVHDQTFKVRGAMSGLKLLKVMGALDGDIEDANGASAMEVIMSFLQDAFLTEDRERAMTYFADSDPPVTFRMLVDIIQWLVEQYTGNPTEQQGESEDGSKTNGSGSSVNAPSQDATSAILTDTSSSPSEPRLQPVPS